MLATTLVMGMVQAAALPMAWRVEHVSDEETGVRHCAVVALGRNVMAVLSQDEGAVAWSVTVGTGNTPHSIRYLRVDEAIFQTIEPAFLGREARDIVERLKRAGEFAFEWARAPGQTKQPGLFSAGDFAARAADCEAWMAGTPI